MSTKKKMPHPPSKPRRKTLTHREIIAWTIKIVALLGGLHVILSEAAHLVAAVAGGR